MRSEIKCGQPHGIQHVYVVFYEAVSKLAVTYAVEVDRG